MILPRVPRDLYTSQTPEITTGDVVLRYLGTAGFVVEHAERTVVIDPFVTRPSLATTLFRPLQPDTELIARLIPAAHEVLIGHAHHDHVLDGPDLCRQTGARFVGSPSACHVARAAGLGTDQIVETRGREDIACGDVATVRGLPSLHGRVYGRVPLPGNIDTPPSWPPRFRQLRHGLVLNWHLDMAGVQIVHVDSADFIDRELDGLSADVVCLCAIGRQSRPRYVETVVEKLGPRYVIACHWDWFFSPYHETPRCLPGVDLAGFVDEIKSAGATPVILPFDGRFGISAV